MKKYVLLICLLLLIIIIVVTYFVLTNRKSTPIGEIKSMSFSYTKGYMMNSDVRYEIEYLDGKYIAKYKPYGESAEKSKRIDSSIVLEIEELFNKYEVSNWDGFNGNDKNVLDGDSFYFSVSYCDKSINASGYMKWPKNYGSVKTGLDDIFSKIFNK